MESLDGSQRSPRKRQAQELSDDIGQLISMATSEKRLYNLTKKYLIPKDIPDEVRPTDIWLKQLAYEQSGNLNSYIHKKIAIEHIQKSILKEIEQKK